ncbi:MmcQ/YjbR family DNA-binding protein [Bacillus coahuilensis]|uniref:MmcQ/YjbR family DNA-binding protein n=1 Tax=Bacillus coahuilensis TaxID=408580 RepID=UPI0001850851|nr:MmcQ/YjbR family DNA-binding protein [Bacillus coahuilensis]
MNKKRLQDYCASLKGTTHDYQQDWQADRYHVGEKMFAMMGGDAKGEPIITLKCDPVRAEELREQYDRIIPGYYMNKTHWNSIYYDERFTDEFVENLIQHSYELVLSKLTKKIQKEILGR